MNKSLITLLALGTLIATPALAQTQPTPASIFVQAQNDDEYLAKDLLLAGKVHNDEGKIIGDIEDLVLNSDNRVEGVVMGTGGFLGMAEKKVGVKLSALKIEQKGGKTYISLPGVTKDMLKAVEPFKRAKPAKSLVDRALERAQELSDKGSVTAKETYEKAKEQAGPAYEKAKETAKQTYDQAKDAVKGAVDKAKDAAAPATAPAPKQ